MSTTLVGRHNEHAVRRNVDLVNELTLHMNETRDLLLYEIVGGNRRHGRPGVDAERLDPEHLVLGRVEAEIHDVLVVKREVRNLLAILRDDQNALRAVFRLPEHRKMPHAAFDFFNQSRERQRRLFSYDLQLRFVEHDRHALAAGHTDVRRARPVGIVLFTVRQMVKVNLSVRLVEQAVARVNIGGRGGDRCDRHAHGGFLFVENQLIRQGRHADKRQRQHRKKQGAALPSLFLFPAS